MKKQLKKLAEFNNAFGVEFRDEPGVPHNKRQHLRYNLIAEELSELTQAMKDGSVHESAKEMADLLYVVFGAVLDLGMADVIEDVFDEVHKSNMSKLCNDMDEVFKTMAHHDKGGENSYFVKEGNKVAVKRSRDGKVLKSVNYKPANIEDIF